MTPCGDDQKGRAGSQGGEKPDRATTEPERRDSHAEPPLDENSLDQVVRDCPL